MFRMIKSFLRFLISRRLWTFIGDRLALRADLAVRPACWPLVICTRLDAELNRLIAIGLVIIFWLFSILIRQLRAARKNRMFVTELAAPPPQVAAKPGEANLAAINTKFARYPGADEEVQSWARKSSCARCLGM